MAPYAVICKFRQALSAERMQSVSMAFVEISRVMLNIAEVCNNPAKKVSSVATVAALTHLSRSSTAVAAQHPKRTMLAMKACSVRLAVARILQPIPNCVEKI